MNITTIKKLLNRATKKNPKSVVFVGDGKYLKTTHGVYLTDDLNDATLVPYIGF